MAAGRCTGGCTKTVNENASTDVDAAIRAAFAALSQKQQLILLAMAEEMAAEAAKAKEVAR